MPCCDLPEWFGSVTVVRNFTSVCFTPFATFGFIILTRIFMPCLMAILLCFARFSNISWAEVRPQFLFVLCISFFYVIQYLFFFCFLLLNVISFLADVLQSGIWLFWSFHLYVDFSKTQVQVQDSFHLTEIQFCMAGWSGVNRQNLRLAFKLFQQILCILRSLLVWLLIFQLGIIRGYLL